MDLLKRLFRGSLQEDFNAVIFGDSAVNQGYKINFRVDCLKIPLNTSALHTGPQRLVLYTNTHTLKSDQTLQTQQPAAEQTTGLECSVLDDIRNEILGKINVVYMRDGRIFVDPKIKDRENAVLSGLDFANTAFKYRTKKELIGYS